MSDELHYAEFHIQARPPLDRRIGYELLSMMRAGQSSENWRETWPEILRVEKAGAHPRPRKE